MTEEQPSTKFDDSPEIKYLIDAWRKTVEVQQHFNDIELRIRNYDLTLLLAVSGAAGFTLQNGLAVWDGRISLAAFLLMAGLGIHAAFYFMDRFWYHRLLNGAVEHGAKLEKELSLLVSRRDDGAFDLTRAIGRHSPVRFFGREMRSKNKIDFFYGLVAFLMFMGICLVWTPHQPPAKPPTTVQCVSAPSSPSTVQ
jgi:hypothetical protein